MKHAGKARSAAIRLTAPPVIGVLALVIVGFLGGSGALFFITFLLGLVALLFVLFTLYFFRDPEARVPSDAGLVVSPGHGTIDAVDTVNETEFMSGQCQRVSMFLSVIDVHVQNSPVAGRVTLCEHTPGQYLNAMKAESAEFNENVLVGFECADPPGERIGVRLIAGLIARRIIPWVKTGDVVARGERMSLIQFGSRVDVYLPGRAKIKVKPGDKAVGGETVLAMFQ